MYLFFKYLSVTNPKMELTAALRADTFTKPQQASIQFVLLY